jgi:hypothetical protein
MTSAEGLFNKQIMKNHSINVSDNFGNYRTLTPTEYLAVGEQYLEDNIPDLTRSNVGGFSNNVFAFLVDRRGISVNYSRPERTYYSPDYVAQIRGNTLIDGNVVITGVVATLAGSNEIVGGTSNFWRYSDANNIYYDGTVTVGPQTVALENNYHLNLGKSTQRDLDNAQFAIQNQFGATFRAGIYGEASNSPIIFNTPANVPIEFHVNRPNAFFQTPYIRAPYSNEGEFITDEERQTPDYTRNNQHPNLTIDTNGHIGINTSFNHPFTYQERTRINTFPPTIVTQTVTKPMSLQVDGPMYACNVLILDPDTNRPQSIDELFIRRVGQTFFASNIIPGTFAMGNYTFQSNLSINGPVDDNFPLYVHGQAKFTSNVIIEGGMLIIQDLTIDNLNVHNNGSFSNNIEVQNNIYFKANLYTQRIDPLSGCNVWTMINIDNTAFTEPSYSNIYPIGAGIATPGRFGTGIDPERDEVNHQFVSTKRDPTIFEAELLDKSTTGLTKALYIGHPSVSEDASADASVVFLTPDPTDNNYNRFLAGGAPQNMYFFPGARGQRISQFQVTASNAPTLGIFYTNRVGINTLYPTHSLDVFGDVAISGDFYKKFPNELDPVKLGIWRQNSYANTSGSGPPTYEGIQYLNNQAPYVGINTIPYLNYGLTIGGKTLSTQGYYTADGYRMVPFYDSGELFNQPTPPFQRASLNGRLAIGTRNPLATLHLRDPSTTSILLSQSTTNNDSYLRFQAENNTFNLAIDDANDALHIFHGSNYTNPSTNRPFLVHASSTPTNFYQTVINSNVAYAQNNPNDALLVNGNVRVQGDVSVSGTYRVQGASVIIAGSNATYSYDNSDPNNIYISGKNILLNTDITQSTNEGQLFVGYDSDTAANVAAVALTERSVLFMRQNNNVSQYVAKYESASKFCLSDYKNSDSARCIVGVTQTNHFYVGEDLNTPFITVRKPTTSTYVVGIGTTTTSTSKLQVFTNNPTETLLKLTHASTNPDTDDFTSDIILEKYTNSTDRHAWQIQGPNHAHQQKLQFIYATNATSNEVLTISNTGSIGIGNTQPTFAIDIVRTGDQGAIRMLQSDPATAKPQLLFQSGSNQYGADAANDYRMYAYSNNFYLDMQNTSLGLKPLLHFTSNNSLGILQPADPAYSVTMAGTLNVKDGIYINGRPFFTVGNEGTSTGTIITGFNIFVNPDPLSYGGVHINSSSGSTSNIFEVNSGLNGNVAVFDSDYQNAQIHLRNKTLGTRRIWRMAASNTSYVLAYRSNVPVEDFIDDTYESYSKASILTQTSTPGHYHQTLYGSLSLEATTPSLSLNDISLQNINSQLILTANHTGIGTTTPDATLHLAPTTAQHILQITNQATLPTTTILPNGNVGLGTTTPEALLHVNAPMYAAAYSFSNAPDTTLTLTDNNLAFSTQNQQHLTLTSNGHFGIGTTTPLAKLQLSSSPSTPTDTLRVITNNQQTFTIDHHGNIGIGTTTPQAPLHIAQDTLHQGHILPSAPNTYSLGSPTNPWQDIYLSASSIYLDTFQLYNANSNLTLQDPNSNLLPITTNKVYLSRPTTNQHTYLEQDPSTPEPLPRFAASNLTTNHTTYYQPISLNTHTNTLGIGTTAPADAFLHIYANSNIPATRIHQQGTGDAIRLTGNEFIYTGSTPFDIRVTHEGLAAIGPVNPDARMSITDNRFKSVLYLNQQSDQVPANDILQLANQGTILSTFNYQGHLGIGTATPEYPLDMYADGRFRSNVTIDGTAYFNSNVYVKQYMEVQGDLTVLGTFQNVSDVRVKTDIKPIEKALDKIKSLTGYTFTMNQTRQTGLIAQEVEPVLPEVIAHTSTGYLSIAYGNMMGLIIEAIKELSEEIQTLKQHIT